MFLRHRLLDLLTESPDGPIPRAAVEQTGITSRSASEARALEWRRKIDARISPGMLPSDRKAAVKAVARNRTIPRASLFWRAIENIMQNEGQVASGWAATTILSTRDGEVRALELKGRKIIASDLDIPTLILDATMQPEPLRHFWPALEVTADVAIETPYQRVVQVQDRTFSKNHLRHSGTFRKVRAFLFRLAREYAPGSMLCVIQKEFEIILRELGGLPNNLDLAHHNAIAGKDAWKDVAVLVVIGRTAPSPQSMEQLAEALNGVAITRSTTWYPEADVIREMKDGSFQLAQSDQHSHPLAEVCRWSVTEAEIVQIIGRARGCNRTGADPVDIWVLGNMPLPVPVDRLINASDLTPSPGDLMAAEGGVELANAADAADAFPALWRTTAAAKSAFLRAAGRNLGAFPYKKLLIRECTQVGRDERPGMVRVTYCRKGQGHGQAVAWFDPARVPDPAGWLSEHLGEMTWVRMA
jgi:putative DNA primase/helicase